MIGKMNIGGTEHLIGSTLFGTCDTPAESYSKIVVLPNFELIKGITIHVQFKYASIDYNNPVRLNVNNTGSKDVYNISSGKKAWAAGAVVSFTYDGDHWIANNMQLTDNIATGTWTSKITVKSGSSVITLTDDQTCSYIKYGPMCKIWGMVKAKSSVSSSSYGGTRYFNLPFTMHNPAYTSSITTNGSIQFYNTSTGSIKTIETVDFKCDDVSNKTPIGFSFGAGEIIVFDGSYLTQ